MLRTAGNRITWLGHSTLQITTSKGKIILIDPWVEGNPSFPASMKSFPRVDLILGTHGHGDHTGDVVSLALDQKASATSCPWARAARSASATLISAWSTRSIRAASRRTASSYTPANPPA